MEAAAEGAAADEAQQTRGAKKGGGSGKGRRRRLCLGMSALVVVVLIVVAVVILGFTVFKPRRPVTTVNSVALKDLRASVDIPRLAVRLNLSLDLGISVNNPNKVGFSYSNTSAFLLYQGTVVGEAPIPAGQISPDSTSPLNLTLTLLADRLLSNSGVYSDVASGTLPFTTSTTISGKVSLLKLFKFHVVSHTSCDLTIHVLNRTVDQSHCNYDTKL